MKQILSFSIILFLFSCSNGDQQSSTNSEDKNKGVIQQDSIIVYNDDISNDPFTFQHYGLLRTDIPTFFSKDFTTTQTIVANEYDASITDTIYHISNGQSDFIFYFDSTKAMLVDADVKDNSVRVKDEIKIGDSYEEILKLLDPSRASKVRSARIFIYNNYGALNIFILEFKDDKLVRMRYNPYRG